MRAWLIVCCLAVLALTFIPSDSPQLCVEGGEASCFFSSSYFQAAALFSSRCEAHPRASLQRLQVAPGSVTHVCVVSGLSSRGLLLHVSGTHGAEGFAGSAVQSAWLERREAVEPTVILVHALNAFGFRTGRRVNENNVDLNRNALFSPHLLKQALARDPNAAGYMNMSAIFNPSGPVVPLWSSLRFAASFAYGVLRFGMLSIKRAFVSAQYHDPHGVMFGGRELQASHALLRDFLLPYAAKAKRVIMVDVHTGLGPLGRDTLMLSPTYSAEKAERIFSHASNPPLMLQHVSVEQESGAAAGYDVVLGTNFGYEELFEAAEERLFLAQEFGTCSSFWVAKALVLDNQGYRYGGRNALETIGVFNPASRAFQDGVVSRGLIVLQQSIAHLK